MAVVSRDGGPRSKNIPGNKIAGAVIWGIGCFMTYAAFDQMTDWDAGMLFLLSVAIQYILTVGQSPVWSGRGDGISYALLGVDAVINFGGTMAILANVDQMGSVQALTATFMGYSGAFPMWLKGIFALVAAAVVAGLPEFLWKLD